ncbi:MAG: hypothetical protein KDB10_06750 [Acidimicrobiales bacterium]|nr:hypothetical protein [Acidimicrobiales bacterium]
MARDALSPASPPPSDAPGVDPTVASAGPDGTAPRSVGRAAAAMGVAAAASRALGGARVIVVAAVLGTSYLGNTFEASNTLPTVVFELLAAGALSAVLVPSFVELFDRHDDAEAERLAGGLLGVFLVLLGTLTVLGMVFAPVVADLLTSAVADPEVAAQQQALATVLLRFFLPQLVLYAYGFLAIALLNAKRVFALPAAAPIGNTVVIVGSMVVFYALAGPDAGLELTMAEQVVLGLGGTLGVLAFVAVPVIDLRRRGFRLRPRAAPRDPAVRRLLALSGWAVLQHTGAALLLGAAIILGGAVEGGVVAYRVAFYVFLAPYGVLAQPIHTAVTPELATDVANGDLPAYGRAVRWGLDALSVTVLPVSAALYALSVPLMALLAFGEADSPRGVELMAAATASLALGLVFYGAFRLLAAAYYALGDSRTPAIVAVVTAAVGVAFMVVASAFSEGTATVFLLGVGHTVAFLLGAIALGAGLRRRVREPLFPRSLVPALLVSVALAAAAWWAMSVLDPAGRLGDLLALAAVGAVGLALWWGAVRLLGLAPERLARRPVVPS